MENENNLNFINKLSIYYNYIALNSLISSKNNMHVSECIHLALHAELLSHDMLEQISLDKDIEQYRILQSQWKGTYNSLDRET